MKINQLFYPLMLLMAIVSLGSAQAEEEKSVGSVGNGLNAIDSCQANYATEGQLDIPCVNVSGVSYAVKLQPIAPDKTQFTLTSVTPNPVVVNSACVATYSLETGQLDVPCVRKDRSVTGETARLVLYANDSSNPSLFGFEQFRSERRMTRDYYDDYSDYYDDYSDGGTYDYFDGAGSLISPTESAYGADKDAAVMHPHGFNARSTVVFQFKKDYFCDHIDISSYPGINVFIQAKEWSGDQAEKAFFGTLPISVPNLGTWTVVAVTSTVGPSLTEKVTINAECKTAESPNMYAYYTDWDLSNWQETVFGGVTWTGTGSIISYLGTGYGKDRDEVIIPNLGSPTLSSFQWYPTDSCKSLTISPVDVDWVWLGTAGLMSKKWDADSWTLHSECSYLPCTISLPLEQYHVVTVGLDLDWTDRPTSLTARCVE